MRVDIDDIARAISSESPTTLLVFIPGAGTNSNSVIIGPVLKLLILPSGDQAIRFRPHLNVTREDLGLALDIINSTIKSTLN